MKILELIAWFEENFACVVGWPMSCTGEGEPPTVEELNASHSRALPGTTRYMAYGLRAEDTDIGRRALVYAMLHTFMQKLQEHPEIRGTRLYWRYSEKIEFCSDNNVARIYTRLAIPALAERIDGLPVHEEGHQLHSIETEAH